MNLAKRCISVDPRINNIYQFGGYVSRNAASIYDYKIKWTRPPRVPQFDVRQTGDLGLKVDVKPSDTRLYYENSKELEDASDLVKKMFSLKFQPYRETRSVKREKIMSLVKRHVCDRGSTESRIAAMTSEISDIQECMKEHPRNKVAKVFLQELVDRRKKQLRLLRNWDYRRFEWILETLNLVYKPVPTKPGMISRKDSLRILTQQRCDDIINGKLNAYKAELQEQQKVFYREKAEKLEYILKEELEYGLEPTVTNEEIEAARKKAEELSKH